MEIFHYIQCTSIKNLQNIFICILIWYWWYGIIRRNASWKKNCWVTWSFTCILQLLIYVSFLTKKNDWELFNKFTKAMLSLFKPRQLVDILDVQKLFKIWKSMLGLLVRSYSEVRCLQFKRNSKLRHCKHMYVRT